MRLSRHTLRTGVALLALCVGLAARAEQRRASVTAFVPSQPDLGRASAMLKLAKWQAKAREHGVTLRAFALHAGQKFANKVVTADITPSGEIINDDTHHGIAAALALSRLTEVPLTVTADIEKDYTGWTDAAFAEDYIARGKGRFRPEMDHRTPLQKMRSLPSSYDLMGNDTLRSTIDTALTLLRLDGEMFHKYTEVDLSRYMRENGALEALLRGTPRRGTWTEVPDDRVFDPHFVGRLSDMLKRPALRSFLISHAASPESAAKISKRLAK